MRSGILQKNNNMKCIFGKCTYGPNHSNKDHACHNSCQEVRNEIEYSKHDDKDKDV